MSSNSVKNDYIDQFTQSFNFEPNRTVLIIIDMQNASASRMGGMAQKLIELGKEETVEYRFNRIEKTVVPNLKKLLPIIRKMGVKVIYVTLGAEMANYSDVLPHMKKLLKFSDNYKGSKNHEILEEIKPDSEDIIVNKTTISAFTSSNLDIILKKLDAKYLLFTGVSTNMCVETTARDAADKGYLCTIIEDCCGATKETYHQSTIDNFQRLFGQVETMKDVIQKLK